MGISGHILGKKNLRKLAAKTGLGLDRAYVRGHEAEGRVIVNRYCMHYVIDPNTGESERKDLGPNGHWTSCWEFGLIE